ncbi:MAG: sulfatase [Bacteroidetes bacterium]|nr:sulfatase [Bacteroidota bacterium]
MNLKTKSYAYLILPILIYSTDILIRWEFLSLMEPKGIINFLISVLFEVSFYTTLIFLISKSRFPLLLSIILGFIISILQVIIYGHYFYFGVLPNNYSLQFLANQFVNTMSLFLNSIEWWHFTALIFLTIFYSYLIYKSSNQIKLWRLKKGIYLLLTTFLLSLFFNNNVRFYSQSFSITPETIFSIKYYLSSRFLDYKTFESQGFIQRKFTIENRKITKSNYNVLIILSESLRKNNLQCYGYSRNTTPFLDSMLKHNKLIQFQNHTSNAVSTQYSVPIMLSGIFSYRKVNSPFIQDYAKHWFGTKNFLISSQLMVRNSIEKVYNTSFDKFICQERSNLPIYNDMAFNDNELIKLFKNELSKLGNNKFFGIIGFNNTHYPYTTTGNKFSKFKPSNLKSINAYDNTILEQDELIKNIFIELENKNLLDSTFIIFTSDHGEAFGEHNHSGHLKTLYEEEINVPLLIYLPKTFPKSKSKFLTENQNYNTSHLDIFPTVMDMFGNMENIKSEYPALGTSLFKQINNTRIIPLFGLDILSNEGIIERDIKYIQTIDGSHLIREFYNTSTDKKELINLWKMISREEQINWVNKLDSMRQLRLQADNLN